jgi:hypothetical protein
MKKTILRVVIDPKDKHQWTDKIIWSYRRMTSPEDFSQIAALGLTEPEKLEINRRLVQYGTPRQIAVAVARQIAEGADEAVITKALIEYGVAQYHAADLVSNIKTALDEYSKSPDGMEIMAYKNRLKSGMDLHRKK